MEKKDALQERSFLTDVSSSSRQPVMSSGGLLRFMQHHPLVCYFLLAYGLSWLGWLPYVLSQSGLGLLPFPLSQLAALPGAYLGPCGAGLLMTAITEGRPGVRRWLRRFVQWRVGWQWYLLVLIGVPAIIMLGTLPLPGAVAALRLPSPQLVLVFLPSLIFQIFTTGLAEEPGWRDFALPRLQQRYGPLAGTLILGPLWAGWHLPLFLTTWAVFGRDLLTLGEFVLGAVILSIVITWIFNQTHESLFLVLLFHAGINAFFSSTWIGLFPMLVKSTTLVIMIGFGAVALLLIIVTRGRLGNQPAHLLPDRGLGLDREKTVTR